MPLQISSHPKQIPFSFYADIFKPGDGKIDNLIWPIISWPSLKDYYVMLINSVLNTEFVFVFGLVQFTTKPTNFIVDQF